MFQPSLNPSSLYNEVSLDTGVNSADSHRLIEMLFEKAEELLFSVDRAIATGDIAAKGEAITRLIRIVDEGLRAALNSEGGEIAQNLSRLYDYILERLLFANQTSSRETVAEVRELISQIHGAWSAIGPQVRGKGRSAAKHSFGEKSATRSRK